MRGAAPLACFKAVPRRLIIGKRERPSRHPPQRLPQIKGRVIEMLRWAAIFFIIAIVAAIFGFGGIVSAAASVAKVLFFIFLILFVVSLIFGRRSTL